MIRCMIRGIEVVRHLGGIEFEMEDLKCDDMERASERLLNPQFITFLEPARRSGVTRWKIYQNAVALEDRP